MTKLRWVLLSICCIAAASCTKTEKQEAAVVKAPIQNKSFFVSVPITKFSSIKSPCVEIGMGEKTATVELDLGFKGVLTLDPNLIEQLCSKTALDTASIYGFRGAAYSTHLYRIPEMNVGCMFFTNPVVEEDLEEFYNDTIFVKKGHEQSSRLRENNGRLGWELFYCNNLLLDIKNSQIAFCDSLATLQEQGYLVEDFVRAPLFIERGCIEFDVNTPEGPLRCMLDTGATWNFLNRELDEGQSLEEAMWDPGRLLDYSFLKISGRDFGPVTFTKIPFYFPVHIEAILGMEFIREHLIFIDFEGRSIYFQAATEP